MPLSLPLKGDPKNRRGSRGSGWKYNCREDYKGRFKEYL